MLLRVYLPDSDESEPARAQNSRVHRERTESRETGYLEQIRPANYLVLNLNIFFEEPKSNSRQPH